MKSIGGHQVGIPESFDGITDSSRCHRGMNVLFL